SILRRAVWSTCFRAVSLAAAGESDATGVSRAESIAAPVLGWTMSIRAFAAGPLGDRSRPGMTGLRVSALLAFSVKPEPGPWNLVPTTRCSLSGPCLGCGFAAGCTAIVSTLVVTSTGFVAGLG